MTVPPSTARPYSPRAGDVDESFRVHRTGIRSSPVPAVASCPALEPSAGRRQDALSALEARVAGDLAVALRRRSRSARAFSVTMDLGELHGFPRRGFRQAQWGWSDPGSGNWRCGVGTALCLSSSGGHRFCDLEARMSAWREGWQRIEMNGVSMPTEAFVGFAFDSAMPLEARFPGGRLHVPELLIDRAECGATIVTFTSAGAAVEHAVLERWLALFGGWLREAATPLAEGIDPPGLTSVGTSLSRDLWVRRVRQGLTRIEAGELYKIVLSRKLSYQATRAFDLERLWSWLGTNYPGCVRYAVRSGDVWLVGASPERFVSVNGRRVSTDAVAGTVDRHAHAVEDARRRAALRRDPKTNHEHALVVRALRDALSPFCRELSVPAMPRLLSLANVHHLWTPLTGDLRKGVSVLDLAHHLYPTPSIGGWPSEPAMRWIEHNEDAPRGWYSGAVGCVKEGDGDLVIALRCALLDYDRAEVYAGAGIVAGSDPGIEFEETIWKLQAMVNALGNA